MLRNAPRIASEVGKIRIGDRVPITSGKHKGDPRPNKVEHFILSSNNRLILQAASQIYGGEVDEWVIPTAWQGKGTPPDHKYRLYTTSNILRIIFRASQAMETCREQWEGGWCVRRCDGEHIYFDAYDKSKLGTRCTCPLDHDERKALAQVGTACVETSRFQVQIYDLPYGSWRLDTKGFYGPAQLRELQDFLELVGLAHRPVEAMMRLETATARRIVNGEKKTHRFQKVVIEPIYTAAQLSLAASAQPRALLSAGESAAEAADALFGEGAGTHMQDPILVNQPPRTETRGRMDPSEFNYRMETLWRDAGLDSNAIAERWGQVMRQCGATGGRIREDWYPRLLEEQAQLMAKRRARQTVTQEQTLEGEGDGDASHTWSILETNADNAALPVDMLLRIQAALSPLAKASDEEAYALASEVQEVLDAQQEA